MGIGNQLLFGSFALTLIGALVRSPLNIELPALARLAGSTLLILATIQTLKSMGRSGTGSATVVAFILIACGLSGVLVMSSTMGVPFGALEYTDRWWPNIEFPEHHVFIVAMPVFSTLLGVNSFLVIREVASPRFAIPAGAVLGSCMEALLEPVFSRSLEYWEWKSWGGLLGAPISNFVGWTAVFLLANMVFVALGLGRRRIGLGPGILLFGSAACLLLIGSIQSDESILLLIPAPLAALGIFSSASRNSP